MRNLQNVCWWRKNRFRINRLWPQLIASNVEHRVNAALETCCNSFWDVSKLVLTTFNCCDIILSYIEIGITVKTTKKSSWVTRKGNWNGQVYAEIPVVWNHPLEHVVMAKCTRHATNTNPLPSISRPWHHIPIPTRWFVAHCFLFAPFSSFIFLVLTVTLLATQSACQYKSYNVSFTFISCFFFSFIHDLSTNIPLLLSLYQITQKNPWSLLKDWFLCFSQHYITEAHLDLKKKCAFT